MPAQGPVTDPGGKISGAGDIGRPSLVGTPKVLAKPISGDGSSNDPNSRSGPLNVAPKIY